jgi:hypothetical protein
MTGADRWRDNWRVVGPPGSVRVVVARRRRAGSRPPEVAELPLGTPVVLLDSGPGALRRSRRFAAAAAVRLESEYLAFPSAATPAYLVEDSPAVLRTFVTHVLVAPPRTVVSAIVDAGLWLLRLWTPWRVVRRVAPGRVTVGRRA